MASSWGGGVGGAWTLKGAAAEEAASADLSQFDPDFRGASQLGQPRSRMGVAEGSTGGLNELPQLQQLGSLLSSSPRQNQQQNSQQNRIRVTRACDVCSKRRRRCDGNYPCSLCRANDRVCTYEKPPAKRGPRRTTKSLEGGNGAEDDEGADSLYSTGTRHGSGTESADKDDTERRVSRTSTGSDRDAGEEEYSEVEEEEDEERDGQEDMEHYSSSVGDPLAAFVDETNDVADASQFLDPSLLFPSSANAALDSSLIDDAAWQQQQHFLLSQLQGPGLGFEEQQLLHQTTDDSGLSADAIFSYLNFNSPALPTASGTGMEAAPDFLGSVDPRTLNMPSALPAEKPNPAIARNLPTGVSAAAIAGAQQRVAMPLFAPAPPPPPAPTTSIPPANAAPGPNSSGTSRAHPGAAQLNFIIAPPAAPAKSVSTVPMTAQLAALIAPQSLLPSVVTNNNNSNPNGNNMGLRDQSQGALSPASSQFSAQSPSSSVASSASAMATAKNIRSQMQDLYSVLNRSQGQQPSSNPQQPSVVNPLAAASAISALTGAKRRREPQSDETPPDPWQFLLSQSKGDLDSLFGAAPLLPLGMGASMSSRELVMLKEPGLWDDLPPLPDAGVMSELVSRFFEDVFVASPILHKPSFLKTYHLRPPFLIYALGSITAPYCSHIRNRLTLSLNLLERARRLLLPAGSGPGPKSCDMVIALFYGSLAASRSWKKDYAKVTSTFADLAVAIARELGLNFEPGDMAASPARSPQQQQHRSKKGPGAASPASDAGSSLSEQQQQTYGLPKWILDEERRRIWWQLYILDRLSMAVSDRPAQINESECFARVPCSNYLWLRGPDANGDFPDPGPEYMGIPAMSVLESDETTVWSEVGVWCIIFRAIGEVFGQFHQFCKIKRVDPYADPAEFRRLQNPQELPRLNQRQEEVLARFDAARELLDVTYDRLPPHFHEIDANPIKYTLDNWDHLRTFRNDKHQPLVPYDVDRRPTGPPLDRHNVLEALYLLLILHNAYAMLYAPKNPHPALASTKNWLRHQAVLGIPTPATRPIMKMASGPNGAVEILRWFPFQGMASGPYPMTLSDGSLLHNFGDLENWPPSPAAICHFHCSKVTELQRTIMMLDDQLVSLPAFCLWSSAQAVIYRLLLHTFTIFKEINEGQLRGTNVTVQDAAAKMMADVNLHVQLMEKLSKRWPAGMVAYILVQHIIQRALEGNMQDDPDGIFTTVGVISDPGKEKVDSIIGRMEELELGPTVQLDQPPAPKKPPSVGDGSPAFAPSPQNTGPTGRSGSLRAEAAMVPPSAAQAQLQQQPGMGIGSGAASITNQAMQLQNQLRSLAGNQQAQPHGQAQAQQQQQQRMMAQPMIPPQQQMLQQQPVQEPSLQAQMEHLVAQQQQQLGGLAAQTQSQLAALVQQAASTAPPQQQRAVAERLLQDLLRMQPTGPLGNAPNSSPMASPVVQMSPNNSGRMMDEFPAPQPPAATAAYREAMFRQQRDLLLRSMNQKK